MKVGNLSIRPIPTQRYSVYAFVPYGLVPLSLRYLVLGSITGAIWSWIIGCTRTVEFTAALDVRCYMYSFFCWVVPHPSFFPQFFF